LIREAVKNDDADFGMMDEDVDLNPIRETPAFAEITQAGRADRRYAAVWSSDASFEAIPIYGLDPAAQEMKCRELIAQGYRPVSWSASRTTSEGPPVTASVWHRPVVSEETKDQLAERQARAAVALVRMGKAEEVWSLLRHSPDPRLRSFVVNWLSPLGSDLKAIEAELERLDRRGSPDPAAPTDRSSPAAGASGDSGRPSVPRVARSGDLATTKEDSPDSQKMDAILFHPETSMRRALMMALGTYSADGLSPSEREPLAAKLLELYRNDPDAGIHGAPEWTLRKWGQQEKVDELNSQLMRLKDRGDRRWYVNSQGQTFTLIEGPVEFCAGSPPTELGRHDTKETPRRMIIPRWFAIAAKEVTVEQWQRYERTNTQPGSFVKQYSPDHDGPMISITWHSAASYCNWGNQFEWVQDSMSRSAPHRRWLFSDNIKTREQINDKKPRLLRGGSFRARAADIRSAFRDSYGPSMNLSSTGFRPSRTYR
jgi:Bacterial tandem repeat domain 1